jgi:Zn-dependent M28 family amino/carboxypeptidase
MAGWESEFQEITVLGQPLVNVIGRKMVANRSELPWIIIGTHYDSRIFADRDPDPELRRQAVPGANDGASGVATLLELARVLPESLPINVWLVFFDGEDNGNIPGWDWILGSRGFVEKLEGKPEAVVIVDMIGDSDLNIFFEKNSDPILSEEIWSTAKQLGFSSQFIPFEKHRILDDHIPFLEAGIPSVDIIDFDYPSWHTTADTVDKISEKSLKIVGDTLVQWLLKRAYGEGVRSP